MKVAIVHEMLVKLGGAEKVVEIFMEMFPKAPVFTLIYDEEKTGEIFPKEKLNSQVFRLSTQKIYNIFKKQRFCLPFMAKSIESLDLSDYDLILVSSSGFAHGIITKPDTKVIVYSHSPARYLWDWTNEYKVDIGANTGLKGFILNRFFLKLRQWDYIAGQRADIVLANSINTASRIKKYHRREALVLYPPVDVSRFSPPPNLPLAGEEENSPLLGGDAGKAEGGNYIIIAALTPFKKIEVAIEAFNNMPDKKLKIIGSGDHEKFLQSTSKENIEFAGRLGGDDLVEAVSNSLGLIFPGEEDFGIVPIEVMAAGKPVFALNRGGLRETVVAGKTGEFFDEPTGGDFIEKFNIFHEHNISGKYNPKDCLKQAQKFDKQVFIDTLKTYIKK